MVPNDPLQFDEDDGIEERVEQTLSFQERRLRYERGIAMRSLWAGFGTVGGIFGSAYYAPDHVWQRLVSAENMIEWAIIMLFSLPGAFMGIKAWAEKAR